MTKKTFSTFIALFILNMVAFSQNNVSLISSDFQGVTIKFSLTDYQFQSVNTTKGEAKTISAENAYRLMQKGSPDVLKMAASVVLPNTGNFTTTVLSEKHTDINSLLMAPSKGNLLRSVKPEDVSYEFGSSYQRDEFFPKSLVNANSPYIARSIRGCAIDANMVQYNPVQKTLRVYSEMIVRINFNNQLGTNELQNPKPIDAEFQAIYQRQYLNFSPAKYNAVSENGELLIICHDAFMSAMQPFVTHKQTMGIKTTMVGISTIGNTVTAIKSYISSYYTNPEKNLKYVLLVGDYPQVTTTILSTSGGSGGSDNTYSYLVGNDHYPDIFVGRFSAETVEHVNTMVNRTISYENDPSAGNWVTSGIGIASSEGPGDNNEYDYTHIRNIRSKLMGYGYTAVAEEYDGSQGGMDISGNASTTRISAAINQGVGIITYCGHGDWNMFVASGFNNTNVNALQNTTKWPFIISVACVNGDFTSKTCFAENWLRATKNGFPTGALATVMSSINQPWDPPMKGQDEMINILTETYSSNIKRTYGGITMNAMMSMMDAYSSDATETMDTWNIFGDPSVMVRTAEATPLTVSHADQAIIGTTSIIVTSPTEGAKVSLSLNGNIIGIGTIVSGTANISVEQITSIGIISVTGSAYNKIPYHGIINAINSSSPFISLSSVTINNVQGNNNQLVDYGDTILLNVTLKNIGLVNANNVSATLNNQGTNTSIIQNSHVFGNLVAGDSTMVASAFKVAISSSVPDQSTNIYSVNITDGTNNWTSYYNLLMNAPTLKNQSISINDAGNENANNILDSSETATIEVPVKNIGHANGGATIVTITTTSADITITNPIVTFSSLNANAAQTASFPVTVSANPNNAKVQFKIVSVCGAYSDTTIFNTRIGATIENWESAGFNKYTWANDITYPWKVVNTASQEGSFCAKSGTISNSKSSTLQISIDVAEADSISFWYKVSSEANYDFLRFYIAAAKKDSWSGEVEWTQAKYPVTAGTNIFKWIYIKDSQESSGSDCAWIDFINLPAAVSTVGIEKESINTRYSVYPNPAINEVNINILSPKAEEFTISMLDITGKMVAENTTFVSANMPNTVQFSTAQLSNGIYFVKLNSSTTQKTIKVVLGK